MSAFAPYCLDRPDKERLSMAKIIKSKAATPAWPDERFKSETPASETFTAYGERPFDPVWGIEHWGSEIHGRRGPQPFHVPVLDENGNPVFGKDSKPLFKPDEEHDVVILTGTGPGRWARHIEPNGPDWRLPAGLTLAKPFTEAGETLLKDMGLADRYADTFTPEPRLLRAALLTTCHVAPEILPTRTGAQIEAILRQHAAALGVVSETPATQRPEIAHSPDFRSVRWYGTEYPFTPQQAEIVKVLWEAYECGTPDVDAVLLLSNDFTGKTGAAKRVRDIFRNSTAWRTMIVPGGSKGTYRLAPPQ